MQIEYFGRYYDELPPAYEIVGLVPGEVLTFTVSGWLIGWRLIHVGAAKTPIEHIAIGLDAERRGPKAGAHKYAFTSRNLVTAFEPLLIAGFAATHQFTVRIHGPKGAGHYELAATPIGA